MAGVINNLYPPIVETYAQTFVINKTGESVCRIHFSLSAYNGLNNIANVQVTLCNQYNNSSILSRTKYPSGIKIINKDQFYIDNDKYYIEISSSDLEENFKINQYYKIQLRFSAVPFIPANPDAPGQSMDSWLATNVDSFSEWSTICLVRGISKPHLDLLYFKNLQETSMIYAQHTLSVIGSLKFEDPNEKDSLESYQVKLYDDQNQLFADSNLIYTNGYSHINEVNYTFKRQLEDGVHYRMRITARTRNLYTITQEYEFNVIQTLLDAIAADVILTPDVENGAIQVSLVPTNTDITDGHIVFRRTSSRSNFTIWEDIHAIDLVDKTLDYTWTDNTIESGIWYKYCAQRKDRSDNRGVASVSVEPAMIIFEDMFFGADSKQLRIKYNPQVSSYKKTVSESKTETIGSKYPFIKRNGAIEYRQFSVSGLITLNTDYQDTFASREQLLGNKEILELYSDYNWRERINNYNDYIHEREFREAVMDFLYADNVKLMRTTTEGNALVKLMDISLSPEHALGRMIYSFSATAYEVDKCSFANYMKYHINDKNIIVDRFIREDGTIQNNNNRPVLSKEEDVAGQIFDVIPKNTEVITEILMKKHKPLESSGYIVTADHLTNLTLNFHMPPYLIWEGSDGTMVPLPPTQHPDKKTVLGYLAIINNKTIYIHEEGIYSICNIPITSVSFPVDTKASLDYTIHIKKVEDLGQKPDIYYGYTRVGQIWDTFDTEDSLIKRLKKRYDFESQTEYQQLLSVNGIRVEANPGTVCWVKDSTSPQLKRLILNDTGSLSLYDDRTVFEGFYLSGAHVDPATPENLQRAILPLDRFIEIDETYDTVKDIKHPIPNGVYKLNHFNYKTNLSYVDENTAKTKPTSLELIADRDYALLIQKLLANTNRYIYYLGRWYPITQDNDILCDTDAIVDYWCSIMKGVHVK